jgi:pimeloyl-ACP methyl ester carboxylesterase
VKAPTLVMHVRDDCLVPIKLGRELAAGIPGARFVALPGKNHVPLEQDPGAPLLFEETERLLEQRVLVAGTDCRSRDLRICTKCFPSP